MEDRFKDVVNNKVITLESLPISIVNAVRNNIELTEVQKKEAFKIIRQWLDYVVENKVTTDNLVILRAHLELFANQVFGSQKESQQETLQAVDVKSINTPEGNDMQTILEGVTNPEILGDERVIIYGGVARTFLRAHVFAETGKGEEYFRHELPINDVDIMVVGADDSNEIAQKYQSDITGTKIVSDPTKEIDHYMDSADLTANQVVIYLGKLLFREKAFSDIRDGVIRASGADKPLFGRDSVNMPDGNVYLLRAGFYRTLASLLRHRGERLVVSKENLEKEKKNIGRYWLVLLFVKLLKIKDQEDREESILQWHQVAKDIGSTTSSDPGMFLEELFKEFPKFSYGKGGDSYGPEEQARWLINRLVTRGEKRITNTDDDTKDLPTSYTPADIILRPYEGNRDLTKFYEALFKYTG